MEAIEIFVEWIEPGPRGASSYETWGLSNPGGTVEDFLLYLKSDSLVAAEVALEAAQQSELRTDQAILNVNEAIANTTEPISNANLAAAIALNAAGQVDAVIVEANTTIQNTETATTSALSSAAVAGQSALNADSATTFATGAGNTALEKAGLADTAAAGANVAATGAITATTAANTATGQANTATTNANTATAAATEAAATANAAKGWNPVLGNIADGQRIVQRLVDYTGGTGTKPTANVGDYLTETGYTTNIALAKDIRGATGQPTAFELRGTGMPEGVLVAPVGTYYTDIVSTNGATRWYKKTGTGNTGWVCVVGDTGVLNKLADALWLSAFAMDGVVEVNRLVVRRVNNLVSIDFILSKLTTSASTPVSGIPIGFRNTGAIYLVSASAALVLMRVTIPTQGSGVSAAGAIASVGFSMTFFTNDPWPTTL